ncbi:hypothetical protein GCM10010377_51920 [Streptomyces viridiviolaceus]|nr:hypothetical protein GCM10010377_51920 [Streptomyces viridiviolaceus]
MPTSLAVMLFLSAAQRLAGRELGSASAVADSKQTLLGTYLSAVPLAGLVLTAALGWSWADPAAALVIAGIAVEEGRNSWQGKGCCAPRLPQPPRKPSRRTGALPTGLLLLRVNISLPARPIPPQHPDTGPAIEERGRPWTERCWAGWRPDF